MYKFDRFSKFDCKVAYNHSSLSSFKSGGNMEVVLFPRSEKGLISTIKELQDCEIPFLLVGGGTNILFQDEGYKGVIVCLREVVGTVVEADGIYAFCGERLNGVARLARSHALSGLEPLHGIPGTVGGAVAMNAGAFGCEMADIVEYADIITKDGLIRKSCSELGFGYRKSGLDGGVVLGAKLLLSTQNELEIAVKMKYFAEKRRNSQPQGISLGSVFKQVKGVSAGYYIEQAGLKNTTVGGAVISQKHANFIINKGGATSSDFVKLAQLAVQHVDKVCGIGLEYEVEIMP